MKPKDTPVQQDKFIPEIKTRVSAHQEDSMNIELDIYNHRNRLYGNWKPALLEIETLAPSKTDCAKNSWS